MTRKVNSPVEQRSGGEVSRKIRRKIEFFVEHFKGWGEVHPLFKRWLEKRMRRELLSRSLRFGEIVEAYFNEELDYLLGGLWLCERDIESYVITFSVDAVSCGFYAIDLLESFYRDPDFWNDPALKFIARAFPIFFVEVGRGLAGKILKEYLVGYARALGCDGWYSYSHDGNRVFVIRGRVSTIRRRLALLRDRQEKMGCESFNRSLVSGRFRIRPDTYSDLDYGYIPNDFSRFLMTRGRVLKIGFWRDERGAVYLVRYNDQFFKVKWDGTANQFYELSRPQWISFRDAVYACRKGPGCSFDVLQFLGVSEEEFFSF